MNKSSHSTHFDVVIVGAGAAGMFCAAHIQDLSVLLLDHAERIGEKIRISGGGRCNFTNIHANWQTYVSQNPRFARVALQRFTPEHMLNLLSQHGVQWYEKHLGQLFCSRSSEQILDFLKTACNRPNIQWATACEVREIYKQFQGFVIETNQGTFTADQLVVATGGMAVPAIGATDFGLKLARQFGLKVVEPKPALVPLTFDIQRWPSDLAGISVQAEVSNPRASFIDDLLFTHKGLSGPAILQISSYWERGEAIMINLLPEQADFSHLLVSEKSSRQQLLTVLSQYLPKRLAQYFIQINQLSESTKIAELPNRSLNRLAQHIQRWQVCPVGTVGYKKAEAMRGGVSTEELNQASMASKKIPTLYFIGEVVDMTGWLGGYNFQWAWSSAYVCAQALQNHV